MSKDEKICLGENKGKGTREKSKHNCEMMEVLLLLLV